MYSPTKRKTVMVHRKYPTEGGKPAAAGVKMLVPDSIELFLDAVTKKMKLDRPLLKLFSPAGDVVQSVEV